MFFIKMTLLLLLLFLLQIVWPLSSLKMLIFMAYCCNSNNICVLKSLGKQTPTHTYLHTQPHATIPLLVSSLSNLITVTSGNSIWPLFCLSKLNPVSFCPGSSGQCPFVVFLAQFHLLWRDRYLYGTGQMIIIRSLNWSYVWLENCDLKSADKPNRYK